MVSASSLSQTTPQYKPKSCLIFVPAVSHGAMECVQPRLPDQHLAWHNSAALTLQGEFQNHFNLSSSLSNRHVSLQTSAKLFPKKRRWFLGGRGALGQWRCRRCWCPERAQSPRGLQPGGGIKTPLVTSQAPKGAVIQVLPMCHKPFPFPAFLERHGPKKPLEFSCVGLVGFDLSLTDRSCC